MTTTTIDLAPLKLTLEYGVLTRTYSIDCDRETTGAGHTRHRAPDPNRRTYRYMKKSKECNKNGLDDSLATFGFEAMQRRV